MTVQLSRERLEEIASWEIENTDAGTRHAPGAHSRVYSYEIVEMARMLLAGLDSKPVAKVETVGVCWYADNGVPRKPAVGAALYAAAPAPVAVPNDLLHMAADAIEDLLKNGNSDSSAAVWFDMPGKLRAAMLNAGPVTEATVPDGWKLVPVEPTKEMMLHKSGCQHHAWDDAECSMRQTRRLVWAHMIAAAPAAPEQEV